MFLLFPVCCGCGAVLSLPQALCMVTYVENGRNNQIIQKQYSIRISLYWPTATKGLWQQTVPSAILLYVGVVTTTSAWVY